jgi:hypothetical protein
MRSAWLKIALFFLCVTAQAQVNPHTQIRWPDNCNNPNMLYNWQNNTCINAVVGPLVDPHTQMNWPAACNAPNMVYNFATNTCFSGAVAIAAGSTTTLPAGSSATVTQTGTFPAYTLNFGIPTGTPGGSLSYPGVVTDNNQGLSVATGAVTPMLFGTVGYVTPQIWGSGANNLANFFGNTANCNPPSKPCFARIDPGYALTEHYTANYYGVAPSNHSMGVSRAGAEDPRNGGLTWISHDPGPNPHSTGLTSYTFMCNHTTYQSIPGGTGAPTIRANCFDNFLNATAPGWTYGYGVTPNGWAVQVGAQQANRFLGSGISESMSIFSVKGATGDYVPGFYVYGYNYGGTVSNADEGGELVAWQGGEQNVTYAGTIASSAGGGTNLKVACTNDCAYPGQGRYLINTHTPVATGQGTATTNVSGNTPGTITINSTVTPSVWAGTLNSPGITTPQAATPTGSTAMTFAATTIAGVGSGTAPVIGDLICFGGNFHEQTLISNVTGAGPYTITANLRHSHGTGSWVMDGGPCGTFIEQTSQSQTPNGQLIRYPIDVLGADNANTLRYAFFNYSVSNNVSLGVSTPVAVSGLTNVAGTVTMAVNAFGQRGWMIGVPNLYISGASDSAFNGLCTNSFLSGTPSAGLLSCTQASSTGHAGPATGNIVVGTQQYGDGANFNLWSGCEVLDVNDYTTSPPSIDGTFLCEPNKTTWNAGDTVEEVHHYSMSWRMTRSGIATYNPYSSKNSLPVDEKYLGAGVGGSTVFGAQYAEHRYNNTNPASMYVYHGGGLTAPGAINLIGPHLYAIAMNSAPDGFGGTSGGSGFGLYMGCPISGCTDPFYNYFPLGMQCNASGSCIGNLQYFPYGNDLWINSAAFHISPSTDTISMSDTLTMAALAAPTNNGSVTSATGGGLAAGGYYYKLVSRAAVGNNTFSQASAEIALTTTGTTSVNHLRWTRVAGAGSYYICVASTSGGTLQALGAVTGADSTTFDDTGALTPSGSCFNNTGNAPFPDVVNPRSIKFNSLGTANQTTLQATAGIGAGNIVNLPSAAGTLALTAQLFGMRAGTWSIASATSAPVTFSPAFNSAPVSCSVTPTADPTAVGALWYTSLTTSGMTVNVHTSGTISGTYQCVTSAVTPFGAPLHHHHPHPPTPHPGPAKPAALEEMPREYPRKHHPPPRRRTSDEGMVYVGGGSGGLTSAHDEHAN